MKKTVVSHFYNEEHLLPWWLQQHKQIFDHGIMIDYHSTDRSCEIIREICPTWEIRTHVQRESVDDHSRDFLDSHWIDQEVMDIERELEGWRMCLNTTEFLYGNIDHLDDRTELTQYLIGNYVFVDMEDSNKGPIHLWHDRPLHEQRWWGYDEFMNDGKGHGGIMGRMNRSLHNYPVEYTIGRHFGKKQARSFDDLVIFYYGWADVSELGIKRKTQMVTEKGGIAPHSADTDHLLNVHRAAHQPISKDIKEIVQHIYAEQQRSIGNKNVIVEEYQQDDITKELAVSYNGTVVEVPAIESKLIQAQPRTIG